MDKKTLLWVLTCVLFTFVNWNLLVKYTEQNANSKINQDEKATKEVTETQKLSERIDQLTIALRKCQEQSYVWKPLQNRRFTRTDTLTTKSFDNFQLTVTIIIYSNNADCLKSQIQAVRKIFSTIKLLISLKGKAFELKEEQNIDFIASDSEGQALNKMISKVNTEYFLYLSEGTHIGEYYNDHSVGWLLDAFEQIPELDFIGSSVLQKRQNLKYDYLDIACYRLKMCAWKFSQSYEYEYSVGDVMICEETSSSFMGRKSSIAKVGDFDESLQTMVTTDFFYRAKHKAIVGLKPEVFLYLPITCVPKEFPSKEKFKRQYKFMEKYQVDQIIDSHGNKISLPAHIKWESKFQWARDHGFLPTRRFEDLAQLITFVSNYLDEQNITYYVDGGSALGAIQMRGVLPWDSGDIDTLYWDNWQKVKDGLLKKCKQKNFPCLSFEVPSNGVVDEIVIKFNTRDASPNTMFHHTKNKPNSDDLLYVPIYNSLTVIRKDSFKYFRTHYDLHYFQHKNREGKNYLTCKQPGHHACVPDAFQHGVGNWKDYYC